MTIIATTPRSRRRKNAKIRVENLAVDQPNHPAFITRKIPSYALLQEEGLAQIEAQSEWILSEIGIEFLGDDEAVQLFKEAGATVNES